MMPAAVDYRQAPSSDSVRTDRQMREGYGTGLLYVLDGIQLAFLMLTLAELSSLPLAA